eukprot:scaffold241581_cov28-Tisochrysis_lutea.AAC.6
MAHIEYVPNSTERDLSRAKGNMNKMKRSRCQKAKLMLTGCTIRIESARVHTLKNECKAFQRA